MNLKRELRKRRREVLKKQKAQKIRNEHETKLIEEFIKQRLFTSAELGKKGEVFSAHDECVRISARKEMNLNFSDFEKFAKKYHLKIKYMDKDLQKEISKEISSKIIIRFK